MQQSSNKIKIKNILYVTTTISGSAHYFSYVHYPTIWYYRLQKKIIHSFINSPKLNFMTNFYPNELYTNPNHNIKVNHKHGELLSSLQEKKYDLILTEAPATTLLEILSTKSQVICFIPKKYIKLHSNALALLKKRAFVLEEENDYLN